MIRLIKFLPFLFFLTLFISCGNDDDVTSPPVVIEPGTGSFTVNTVSIDLTQGFYFPDEFVTSSNLYASAVIIADGGYTALPDRRLDGAATAVFIRVYSDRSNASIEGTYEIAEDVVTSGQAEVYVAINYDIINDTLDEDANLESGTLSITRASDGTYNVSIENGLTDFSTRTFVMTYDGAIVRL